MSRARDDITVSAPQLGKTFTGQMWLISAALQIGRRMRTLGPVWWAAPTHKQAKHGFLGLCEVAVNAGVMLPNAYTTSPPLEARFLNGTRLEGRSWERPEGLYGPTVLAAVVDEFGQLTDHAYGALSSRRAESVTWGYGFYRYLGNVGEIGGTAERLWKQAEAGESGFRCRRWSWHDRAEAHVCVCNRDVPVEIRYAGEHDPGCPRGDYLGFLAHEQTRMSGPQFRQLYGAEWVDWNALPAYLFDRTKHIRPDLRYDPHLPLDVSCDFNVDPMVWVLGQHRNGEAWALHEVVIPGGATTRAACREVIRLYPHPKHVEVVVYGDASGRSRDTRSKSSDYDIIQAELGGYYNRFRLEVPTHNPPVGARLNAVNAKLEAADGTVSYWVHPECTTLADDYARVSLRPGTRDLDKSNKALTHASDADGYRLARLYPVSGVIEAPAKVHTPAGWADPAMGGF